MKKNYASQLQKSRYAFLKSLLPAVLLVFLVQPLSAQFFTKIATGTLVETPKKTYSASWADYNNDGFDDMLIVDNTEYHSSLFTNNGDGTFTEVTNNAIYENMGPSIAAAWGDYNNDGNIDLYICNTGNSGSTTAMNFLYRNDGNGVFTRILEGSIVTDTDWSLGAAWADYDNDGNLDLYVANFLQPNALYHNNGDGTFTRITEGEIVTDDFNTYSASWADIDNDGFQDLFVVNYFYSALPGQNDCLYRNNGDGTFTKNTTSIIVNDAALTQGSSWGDYNNDGLLDLFVTVNEFSDIKHNFLYKNLGNGNFEIANSAPSIDGGVSFGSAWLDMNNDGFLDLTVSNNGGSTKRLNFLYLNNGNETFTNQIADEATTTALRDFCSTIADYNHDGYPDIFTPSYSTTVVHGLYKNNGGTNNYVTLRLEGTVSNRSAIGARVYCYANGMAQTREVSSSSGQYTGSSLAQTFGIGAATAIDSIAIHWPSGIHQVIENPAINQIHQILEVQMLNNETDILTFSLDQQTGAAVINATAHTVSVEVANGTNLTALAPVVNVSAGATVNPASGATVNFANGAVSYTVTAENGTDVQVWTVTVTEEIVLNNATDILSFTLAQQTGAATINPVEHTVAAQVPFGTNLTALAPVIAVSAGATVNPASGATVNFANGAVSYTVTAENGTDVQVWTVTVTEEVVLNNATDILSFALAQQTGAAVINATAHTVLVEVANGTNLTALAPLVTISAGATVNPASGATVNFANGAVSYTVTAENGTDIQVWTVTVTEEIVLNNATDILSFTLAQQTGAATINPVEHTVAAQVPFGTNLTALAPVITVSAGATVNPASGATVNFANGAVSYTVTAENGTDVQVWSVTVTAPVGINEATEGATKLTIYPNPSTGDGNIHVSAATTGGYEIHLLNHLGQTLRSFNLHLVGNESKLIQMGEMEQGLYIISIKGNGMKAVQKMLIVK